MARDKESIGTCYKCVTFCSSFLIGALACGQLLSFGVYYFTLQEYFQLDKKTTSLIGGICFACANLIGPIAGVLQQRYGARLVILVGAFLATLGTFTSYFAQDYWHLYVSYGFVTGTGLGLTINPALSILPEYFDEHRYLVTVLFSIGGPLCALGLAPFTLLMIETYGWRGSMLINAGLCAQMIVLGMILKSRFAVNDASIRQLLTAAVLRDRRFVLTVLDGAVTGGASFVVFGTVTDLVISRGLTPWESATLVSVAAFTTTLARILAAFISVSKRLDRFLLYTVVSLSACGGVLGCVFANGFWTYAISLSVFGLSYGMKISQIANVIIDIIGVESLSVGLGYYAFSLGIGGFVLPAIAGSIADHFGADKSFLFLSITILAGFFCCIVALVLRRRLRRKLVRGNMARDENETAVLNGSAPLK